MCRDKLNTGSILYIETFDTHHELRTAVHFLSSVLYLVYITVHYIFLFPISCT